MAIVSERNGQTSLAFTSGETGKTTNIAIFKYQRPNPGAKMTRDPIGFVTLPYPTTPVADVYNMSIGSMDLGLFGNIPNLKAIAGPDPLQRGLESLGQLNSTVAERMGLSSSSLGGTVVGQTASTVAATAASILALAPGITDTALSATAQSIAGIVANPHTTMLFNGVGLRQFTLNWQLSPRSEQESRNIDSIIRMLKIAMHPNKLVGGFALDYPNLVTMQFNNDKQGTAQIDYAFISDLTVDPGTHAYYKNGYPSFINLQMTVKETRIKTAEDFSGSTNYTGLPESGVNFK
jgi:hypothetical protein